MNTNAQHTPGKWEWDAGIIPPDGPGRYSDIYVLGEDREPIILAEFNDSIPEGRANARLIAAAPDLLEALEELTGDYTGGAENALADPYVRERALAAITQATGEPK